MGKKERRRKKEEERKKKKERRRKKEEEHGGEEEEEEEVEESSNDGFRFVLDGSGGGDSMRGLCFSASPHLSIVLASLFLWPRQAKSARPVCIFLRCFINT